jgi:SMODS and SLOG-associating 2TM effector domain family 5
MTNSNDVPAYTQDGFDKQLNYNLWSTSRTRFIAARKLKEKNERSSKAIAFLSADLIFFSLFDFFFLTKFPGYNVNFIIFINIMFSLLILVFSQNEASASYAVRSFQFHQCGLKINKIYKELRILKSRYNKEKDKDFHDELAKMNDEYDIILSQSENHEMIYYELFKAEYPKYIDHNLNWFQVKYINLKYYAGSVFFYHFVTYTPFILFIFLLTLVYLGKGNLIFTAVHPDQAHLQ